MKKSLLALAAIAAVSGSAFAQSSVTIYGRIDQGIAQYSEAVKNIEVRSASANRLGFRGVEDLGGGLKAFFQIEHRFDADTGTANAVFWDGKSFVGLRSNFGDFYIGREDNPAYALSQSIADPFGTDTVAQNTTILNGRGIATTRYANSLNYRGTFGGFTVGAQIAERASAAEQGVPGSGIKAQQVGDDRPYSIAANYIGGPVTVGVGFENPANDNAKWTTVNAAYDLRVVKLIGLFGFGNDNDDNKRRGYILGLTAPIGSGELKASYGWLQQKAVNTNVKTNLDKQLGIGYHYALSKRTTLYTDLVHERNDAVRAAGSQLKKTGWDVGIKHNF